MSTAEKEAREPLAAWEAACWALGWAVDHYKGLSTSTNVSPIARWPRRLVKDA